MPYGRNTKRAAADAVNCDPLVSCQFVSGNARFVSVEAEATGHPGLIGGIHLRRLRVLISAEFAEKDNVIHPQLQELAALRTM